MVSCAPDVRAQAVTSSPSVAATWAGAIQLPGAALDVTVVLRQDESRAWTGAVDIPAQKAKGLPLTAISVEGAAARFAIAGVGGNPTFAGTMSEDGTTLAGTFTQGQLSAPFELRRTGPPSAVAGRPQEPRPPFPYRSEDVTFRNDAANITLAGTLTLPQGAGPFPAVLLISGSGSQDRDSTIAGHKPFLLIADTLTRRGIAVLRVDDRGVGGSERGLVSPTTAGLAGDTRAGVSLLAARSDIRRERIGLVGHSEGGVIAAMLAADDARVAFIVMLAGGGVRGDELLMQQAEVLLTAGGTPRPLIDWDLKMRRSVYDIINAEVDGKPNEAARQVALQNVAAFPGMPDASTARQTMGQLMQSMSAPWWRYFLSYDPATALARVKIPVLAVIGTRDTQVPSGPNLAAIRAALSKAGNTAVTVRELPNLNHLFQTATTGSPDEYASIEETIAPSALSLLADWIVEQTK
jgi:pimeloyl-ACP methyl ester carboxylesterase